MASLPSVNHRRKVIRRDLFRTHHFVWHLFHNHIFSGLPFSSLCYIYDFNSNWLRRRILNVNYYLYNIIILYDSNLHAFSQMTVTLVNKQIHGSWHPEFLFRLDSYLSMEKLKITLPWI